MPSTLTAPKFQTILKRISLSPPPRLLLSPPTNPSPILYKVSITSPPFLTASTQPTVTPITSSSRFSSFSISPFTCFSSVAAVPPIASMGDTVAADAGMDAVQRRLMFEDE